MKKYKWIIILLNLILLLGFFNYSLVKKEKILSEGKLVLLKLAPVDPRSLMQGDYMALNYEISQIRFLDYLDDNTPKRGFCVVKLDSNNVASLVRLQQTRTHESNEYIIGYNAGTWGSICIGAESFFFQEGQGSKYESAKYGGVRIDQNGNSVLVGLYDEQRREIK